MELKNKNTLVVGLGSSGEAAASFLINRGAKVTVTDMTDDKKLKPVVENLHEKGIRFEMGEHRPESFENADMIVISPGVPHTISPIQRAREKGVPVLGEIELASRFIAEPIVAVTGTNGKTTTTTLIGEMLRESGKEVFVGGNIGVPLIKYPDSANKAEMVVVEVSSFQLDTISRFRPKVSVLLNIAEDHLDRYPDLSAYARSKARIFENQKKEDTAVINGSDPMAKAAASHVQGLKLMYCRDMDAEKSSGLRDAVINDRGIRFKPEVIPAPGAAPVPMLLERDQTRLPGMHNLENIAAAALAAMAAGGSFEGVKKAVKNFKGLAHRTQYVATINDIEYYDDSKATNPDAVARAVESFDRRIVLILGGRNKDTDFKQMDRFIKERVKSIVALGESREEVHAALSRVVPVQKADSMEEAVDRASRLASPGELVLLSPACSSFDMFQSYAHRGDVFQREVNRLKRKVA